MSALEALLKSRGVQAGRTVPEMPKPSGAERTARPATSPLREKRPRSNSAVIDILPESWAYPNDPPLIHNVEQGTTAWRELRAGIPTASAFDRIVTPGGKPCKPETTRGYMFACLAERMMRRPIESFSGPALKYGSASEADAVAFYELQRSVDTVPIGFMTDPQRRWGASPDRAVDDEGLLETKCPFKEHVHVSYLMQKAVSMAYYPQVQGQLWVSGRKWVDVLSYHPEMPPALIRVDRDEQFIGILARAVVAFCAELEEWTAKARELGYFEHAPEAPVEMPADRNNPEVWAAIMRGMDN